MSLPSSVKMVDVSPRDGLQNEASSIPTEIKLELIHQLGDAGLKVIEATSFVLAPKIPQLADADELYPKINQLKNVSYPVLVPNTIGLQRALDVGVKDIAVFCAVSETFSKKNTNCTIAQSMQRIEEVAILAKKHKLSIRGYISCVLGCPYEGETDIDLTLKLTDKLLDLGCYEVSLGDTIGVGTPGKVKYLLNYLFEHAIEVNKLAVHFHDTYGQALANIYAALELGISTVDSSVAGLGGCPYAKGATGNVASEDVLYMLNGLGIKTDVDLDKLIKVGGFISNYLKRNNQSKAGIALLHKLTAQ